MREGEGVEAESDAPSAEELFSMFWEAYPECARRHREATWAIWKQLNPPPAGARRILDKLEEWKTSKRWTDDGGAFIPNPENFLNPKNEYLSTKPVQPKGAEFKSGPRQLDEEEIAAIQRLMAEPEQQKVGTDVKEMVL